MHEYREFPKWKYHATHEAVIVKDAEAEAALGAGWVDSPADVQAGAEGQDSMLEEIEEFVHEARARAVELKKPTGKKAK